MKTLTIEQNETGLIFVSQDDDNCLILSRKEALRLAYRLMSKAAGQGPSALETIEVDNDD